MKLDSNGIEVYNIKDIYRHVEKYRKNKGLPKHKNFTLYNSILLDYFTFLAKDILNGAAWDFPRMGKFLIVKKLRKGLQVDFKKTRDAKAQGKNITVYRTNKDFFCIHWYKAGYYFNNIVFKLSYHNERQIPKHEDKLRLDARLFKQ